jgi:hypothetical protein
VAINAQSIIYIQKSISHISRKSPIEPLTSNTLPFSRIDITTRSEFVESGLFAMKQNSRNSFSITFVAPEMCKSFRSRNIPYLIVYSPRSAYSSKCPSILTYLLFSAPASLKPHPSFQFVCNDSIFALSDVLSVPTVSLATRLSSRSRIGV